MSLSPGTRLGTYEIVSLIGAGGMGEVYKARDPKLNRMVAIKVLTAALTADANLLARFEREAKAVAALSHPNILGIFDFATEQGVTYAVMELLEGENLRSKLKGGGLTPKRAVEIAIEVALGLGAAHEQGLIHRDVKPENIFITKDGRVKVLDFGLAKQVARSGNANPDSATMLQPAGDQRTEAGVVMGTAGYMSPEQVRGDAADHRSDIFAFGVVLHELLSGTHPFAGKTPFHTMTAILDQEPAELVTTKGLLPPALERLVSHCLEKRPEARFQSMKDIAFALQNLSTMPANFSGQTPALRPKSSTTFNNGLGALAVLLLGVLFWACHWPPFGRAPQPTFTRVSFAPGTLDAARFGPDGKVIYFSQRIQGGAPEVFVIASSGGDPKPLGVANALLLGVSATNELAVLATPRPWLGNRPMGTLAQVNGAGGALKEIQENVLEATWSDQGLAIIGADDTERQLRLEFPPGRTLLQGGAGSLSLKQPRVSRDGDHLAVVWSDYAKSEIYLFDRQGRKKVIFTKPEDWSGDTLTGLAWGPDGQLWCSEVQGDQTAIWSITTGGRQVTHWRGPGACQLMDISLEGRMLVIQQQERRRVVIQKAGEAQPREASVLGGTQAMGLSNDGRTLLLLESGVLDGGTAQDLAFLRNLEAPLAVKLAKGTPRTLSPDGKFLHLGTDALTPDDLDPALSGAYLKAGIDPKVALNPLNHQNHMLLVPTGPGRPQVVPVPLRFDQTDYCQFHPDGHTLVFNGTEKGKASRWYVTDRQGGEPKGFTPDGYGVIMGGMTPLSPDGKRFLAFNQKTYLILSLDGGPAQPVQGIKGNEAIIRWAEDGRHVFLRSRGNGLVLAVTRLDPATGERQPVLSFTLPDPAGFQFFRSVHMTPDGRTFAFTFSRKLSELYVVDGVR